MLDPNLNKAPEKIKSIHIMGICGTGMAALAGMLQQSGYSVTGSDSHVYPPMSDYLEQIGITPSDGYSGENLNHNPDLVVVGNVITKKNPEAISLSRRPIHYLSFPQTLAELFIKPKLSIVVAGTHGKTTTCSLLASSLYHAGLDPSFMIGGIVSEFGSNNRLADGLFFVVEGDEYDTAFFDKESKFLHYLPQIAIITSIEFDHADIFDNLDQIKKSFIKFVNCLPENGIIIANLDDENVVDVVADAPCHVEGYGFSSINEWRLGEILPSAETTEFKYSHEKQEHSICLPLSGRHNCLNSLAVAAVMHHAGLSPSAIRDSIFQFKGVKRRQEVRGKVGGITVLDDFAHHPTAVAETLNGIKQANPENRLIAVFEPRTNSSRRSIFQQQYVQSFDAADLIVIREPLPLDNIPENQLFSSAKLSDDLQKNNKISWAFTSTDEILDHLRITLKSGDIVAILSNGGFENIHERLLKNLRNTFE